MRNKSNTLESSQNHLSSPQPLVRGKIVFSKTGPSLVPKMLRTANIQYFPCPKKSL